MRGSIPHYHIGKQQPAKSKQCCPTRPNPSQVYATHWEWKEAFRRVASREDFRFSLRDVASQLQTTKYCPWRIRLVLVYMLTWLGYIDGIHGTPYIAAPWILWVLGWFRLLWAMSWLSHHVWLSHFITPWCSTLQHRKHMETHRNTHLYVMFPIKVSIYAGFPSQRRSSEWPGIQLNQQN